MSNLDESLDDGQRAVVEARERAILVLAGPGSGKTRALVERTRALLALSSADACRLMTFTNKAAAEMATRATALLQGGRSRVLAGTYHNFAAELLRAHGNLIGVPQDFVVLEEDEAKDIQVRAAAQCGLDKAKRLADQWSRSRLRKAAAPAHVARFGQAYQALKRQDGGLDYDDMIISAAALLTQFDAVAQAMTYKAPHVLIDEFQDTSPAQFEMVASLMKHAKTISVFADDDQAIYRFAGAERGHVMTFARTLSAKVYPLDVNYRSRAAIVAAANAVLEHDAGSSRRRMRAVRPDGNVEMRGYADFGSEASAVATDVAAALAGGAPPNEMAVLARNGNRASVLVAELQRRGVPLADWRRSASTHGRRAFAASVASIVGRITSGQAQRFRSVLNLPASDVGGAAFLDAHRGDPVVDALAALRQDLFRGAGVQELAKGVQAAFLARAPQLAAQMSEMVDHVSVSCAHDAAYSLEHLLEDLALGARRRPEDERGLKIATLHKTKGLQWKHVFFLGVEEGTLPGRCDDADELSDERRLFFVGVSRACDRLTLTHVGRRSMFVDELASAGIGASR